MRVLTTIDRKLYNALTDWLRDANLQGYETLHDAWEDCKDMLEELGAQYVRDSEER